MKKIYTYILLIALVSFVSCKNETSTSSKSQSSNEIEADKVNGQYHGKYIELNPKGAKVKEGYMLKGKKVGVWKYYQNNDLVKAEKYVNDSLQLVLDENDYKYEEKYLKEINSYLAIPKNWKTNLDLSNQNILLTSVKDCENQSSYCPNIVVSYEELGNTQFEDYVIKNVEALTDAIENFKEIEFKESKISRIPSFELKYLSTTNEVDIAGVLIWLEINNKVITFNGNSPKNEISNYRLLFQELGYSITLKQ